MYIYMYILIYTYYIYIYIYINMHICIYATAMPLWPYYQFQIFRAEWRRITNRLPPPVHENPKKPFLNIN